MKILIAGICIFVLAAGAAAGLRVYRSAHFEKDVQALFASSAGERKTVRMETGDRLPDPVRKYMRFALKEGIPVPGTARLVHGGRFKTSLDGGWADIRGEEYFLCSKPGFLWRGFLTGASAVDRYVGGSGSLSIYLFSVVKIMEGKGPAYDQGELLRWLGEALWFPTALFYCDGVEWRDAGNDRAELVLKDGGLEVSYQVFFAPDGKITRVEAMRYMNGKRMEKWVGRCSEWAEVSGMMIPRRIEGGWGIGGKEMMYADFTLERIEYDVKELFR